MSRVPLDGRDFAVVDWWTVTEKTPEQVAEYVPQARKAQLRVVARRDVELYRTLQASLDALREQFRHADSPGPVESRHTVES